MKDYKAVEITISKRIAILKAKADKVLWIELKPGYVYKALGDISSDNIVGYLQNNLVERINFVNGLGDPITLRVNYENI